MMMSYNNTIFAPKVSITMAAGLVVNRTWPEYMAVRILILFMRDLPWLLLGLWLVIYAMFGPDAASRPFSVLIATVGGVEALFYLVFFLPYRWWLQTRPPYQPPPLDRAQRAALFYKALENVPEMVPFLRKWMNNAPLDEIRRENVKDWLLWAFFERETATPEMRAELDQYLEHIENLRGLRLPAGRGDAEPIRLCFDPVLVQHRSLFYILVTSFIDHLFCANLIRKGWIYHRPPAGRRLTFPIRLMHLMGETSPGLPYWYREHRNPAKRPIVFVHGLGLALVPYHFWFKSIPEDVGMLVVEIIPVGGRVAHALPSTLELCEQIAACVHQVRQKDQAWDEFVLIGNSYGTMVMGPLLKRPDIGPRVAASVLVDPVSLLLHLPDVAYNFTRREPRPSIRGRPGHGNEWEMWWASATEADTAFTLARRFCWRESILWREDLMPSVETGLRHDMRSTVVLGGIDCVTCPSEVASYVYSGSPVWTPEDKELWKAYQWTGRAELELMYLDEKDHGQGIMVFSPLPVIQHVIDEYTMRNKAE